MSRQFLKIETLPNSGVTKVYGDILIKNKRNSELDIVSIQRFYLNDEQMVKDLNDPTAYSQLKIFLERFLRTGEFSNMEFE